MTPKDEPNGPLDSFEAACRATPVAEFIRLFDAWCHSFRREVPLADHAERDHEFRQHAEQAADALAMEIIELRAELVNARAHTKEWFDKYQALKAKHLPPTYGGGSGG